MLHLHKGSLRATPDFVSRGIDGYEVGMSPLQINQLPVERVILSVADLRLGLLVVKAVMVADLTAQFLESLLRGG